MNCHGVLCHRHAKRAARLSLCWHRLVVWSQSDAGVHAQALCNPSYTRGLISEVLFECYGAPSLAYACDSLLAYDYSANSTSALVFRPSSLPTYCLI